MGFLDLLRCNVPVGLVIEGLLPLVCSLCLLCLFNSIKNLYTGSVSGGYMVQPSKLLNFYFGDCIGWRVSDTLHRFCKKEHDWGWKKFMELSKVLDGFTVADTLVIKAQVQVIRSVSFYEPAKT